MLVLSRRVDEAIVLPTLDITIKVLSVRPGKVRIGIEGPPHVGIWREELMATVEETVEAELAVV